MANKPFTYHGMQITFADSAFSGALVVIGENEQTREPVETTHHGTTVARTFRPEDLKNCGDFDIEFHFDSATAPPDLNAAAETITITYPIPPESADTVPATLAGTAFLTVMTYPEVEAGATETAKIRLNVKWDGETPPVLTPQAAA